MKLIFGFVIVILGRCYIVDVKLKLVKTIISYFKDYFMIINKSGKVLWTSGNMVPLLNYGQDNNIESIFEIEVKKILNDGNLVLSIDEKNYKISKIYFDDEELIALIFEQIGDFNEATTRIICLEEIIRNFHDGVLLTDRNGKVVIYNEAMEELEKYDAKDMIGKYIWDAYGYNDMDGSEHMQVFNSGVPIVNKYKAHAYNEGKPVVKSYSTYPIQVKGETIGVYSISKDEIKLQNILTKTSELKRQYNKESVFNNNELYKNGTRYNFSDIIGSSEVMENLIKEAQAISWLDNNVLIVGDTGTGKELFVQSIHNFGKRHSKPFIAVNCSAIPENLLESILFGSVEGSFTGALDSSGLFEEAGEGTLFLDELNSMPLNTQAKLLRVIQEKTVRRVGGKDEYPIKCRIISAMNQDPLILVEKEILRSDLFYRLAGYQLYIPPLKDRGNDLFEFTKFYLSKFNILMNKNVMDVTNELRNMMENYEWPGNVRELEHFIENIMVRTNRDDKYLRAEKIPDYILDHMYSSDNFEMGFSNRNRPLQNTLDEIERSIIIKNLDKNKWNVTKSAENLGVTRQSLIYRMKKLDIDRKQSV